MPHSKYDHLIGSTIGFLKVLRPAPSPPGSRKHRKRLKWDCLCACGKTVTLLTDTVARGTTVSCGCWKAARHTKHGHLSDMNRPLEYLSWSNMRQRCSNPKNTAYKNYGARGIRVCERWDMFENFLADMGLRPTPSHSIDRIDNDKGYSPDNCKWATRQEQTRNTRHNRMLTLNGQTMCMADWVSHMGLNISTVRYRLFRLGWTIERALTTPVKRPPPSAIS